MSSKKTFHVLGLCHTVSNYEFNACAYTMKVINFCKMMKSLGHNVYHYGVEGADVEADECIDLITKEKLYSFYGYNHANWKNKQFSHNINDEIHVEFNRKCKEELSKRLDHMDFVISMFGVAANFCMNDLPITVIPVEAGLGHVAGTAPYKIFESHSIMAQHYGRHNSQHPPKHDTVIQNYFNVDQFDFSEEKRKQVISEDGYWLVLGRVITCKGGDISYGAAKLLGSKIKFAGQGTLDDLKIDENDPDVEFVGHVDIKKRNELLSGSKGLIICSRYLEPFGGVAIEAMLLGVPVIAANRGSFPENIIQGYTGFLVHDHSHMITSMLCCAGLDPKSIHEYAVANFSTEHVKHRYDEYFERLYMYKLYGSNVIPTLSRIKPIDTFGRIIPGLPVVKSKQLEYYAYQFGYFGVGSTNVGMGTSIFATPIVPILNIIEEDETGIMKIDDKTSCDRNPLIPKTFDFYHAVIVPDDVYEKEKSNNRLSIGNPRFSTYDQFLSWLYSGNNNTDIVVRKIEELHFFLDPKILVKLVETFDPETIIVYNKGVENWKLYGYRVESFHSTDQPFSRLVKDKTAYPKNKIAIWTEGKWALGRIAQGLKKYSKRCDIDIIDWDYPENNSLFWNNEWMKYDTITGNSHITSSELVPKEAYHKLRPTVHSPLINHEHYKEELGDYSDYISAISSEVKDILLKTVTVPKILHITEPGVDLDEFVDRDEYCGKIKTIGFIGRLDSSIIHPRAGDIKRPEMAIQIIKESGCEVKEIFGYNLKSASNMFLGVDLVISTSTEEGGPLGLFEAAASGVAIFSTKVGNIQTLKNIKTFVDLSEAISQIKYWNNNIEEFNDYRKRVTNEVKEEWSWEKKIDAWDDFLVDRRCVKNIIEGENKQPKDKKTNQITDPNTIQKIKDIMSGKREPDGTFPKMKLSS